MFVTLLIFLVILGIIAFLVQKIPMQGNIKEIINAVFVIVAILGVLEAIGVLSMGILNSIPYGR